MMELKIGQPGQFIARPRSGTLVSCLMTAAIFYLFPLLADRCHAATLQDIDVVSFEQTTEVILRFDEKIQYKYDNLQGSGSLPPRCYLDLYGVRGNQSMPSPMPVDSPLISKIRTGRYSAKLRIVLDLKKNVVCSIAASETFPFRIRISVADPSSSAAGQAVSLQPEGAEADQGVEDNLGLAAGTAKAEAAGDPALSAAMSSATEEATGESAARLSAFTSSGRDVMSVWGWTQAYAAFDLKRDSAEDNRLLRLRGRLGADWNKDLSPDYSLRLHGAIDLDRLDYDADLADDETDLSLRETYLRLNSSAYDLSFGNQRVRWGKSDQLSPVDSINPQDLRQFVTIDLEDRALPSWLLRSRWHGASISLETILQPWFQESELEYFDSNWALYRNLRQTVISAPLVPEDLKDEVRHIRVDEDKPANTPENMSAAARLTWQAGQADFAVSYHYGWETLPTIISFPVKNINFSGDPDTDPAQLLASAVFTDERVLAEYKRQQTIGFEWETVLDPIGFRGEIAYIDHTAFLGSALTSIRKPVTHLVTGIDYSSANEWYFNLQGSWHHIHDYSREILYFEEETVSVLGEISKPVWRGNLEFALQYHYTLTDRSSYLKPSITLRYFRNLEYEVGAVIFSGDGETLMGAYDWADQVYGRLKISY